MKYELLIRTSTGEISHFQKTPCQWGKKEKPPLFKIIKIDVKNEQEIIDLKNFFKYDFTKKKFIKDEEKINVQKLELDEQIKFLQQLRNEFIIKTYNLPNIKENLNIIEVL